MKIVRVLYHYKTKFSQELLLVYRLLIILCIYVNQFNLIMICSGKREHMNYIYKSLLECNNK